MNNSYKIIIKYMFFAIIIINIFTLNISFAKLFDVNVSNTKFTPKNITIGAGDTVRWTNTQGMHNVNGSRSSFPNNPESFGNEVGEGWIYIFKFTMPGKYDYECTPHRNFGMVGSVTVDITNDVKESQYANNGLLNTYPNPASEYVTIGISSNFDNKSKVIIITDMNGRETDRYSIMNLSSLVVDTRNYAKGTYYISEIINGENIQHGMFIVK
ncbi:MAG: T9SS type A sorting domain-containing protein [Bacteroidetes bacterium]|nr:MAG: T9SS type A sorting domain-containing protein [Bacteroidota bacterium]